MLRILVRGVAVRLGSRTRDVSDTVFCLRDGFDGKRFWMIDGFRRYDRLVALIHLCLPPKLHHSYADLAALKRG